MNKIIFHSDREYNSYIDKFYPEPTSKSIPKWYQETEKYEKNKNGIPKKHLFNNGKVFSFKACPALLDIFITGYLLKTPCDLYFYKNKNIINVKTPKGYEDFCAPREPMPDFETPHGYYDHHFHWYPQWSIELPEGYSALYLNPVNRYDLPFITVSGIIDNDKVTTSGLMPFFLKKDFEGIIKAGTPFVQIIPFKREDWSMELKMHSQEEIIERFINQGKTFRTPEGEVYKKKFWSKRKYQ
jgi:hypothetical protein